jgi:nucleoside-diphosphate-sugar epimerase
MIKKVKKILLLGGSGYLGNGIASRFEQENEYVITIGDLVKHADSKCDFIEVDVLNWPTVSSVIKKHDLIINCTGQITNPINACFTINTVGVDNIVQAAKSHNKKLYHISTTAVYGTAEYADENSKVNPESPYAACKSFAEYQIIKNLDGKKFCILRLPNLYGENQTQGIFAYILKSYLSDKKLYFNNDGSLSRYFLSVDDCGEAIFLAIHKNLKGIFNITSNDNYNVRELISLIEATSIVVFKKNFDQIKPIENIDKLNFNAFNEATGFAPKTSLRDFIKRVFTT